jgi:hypothetical protein
MPYVHLRQMLVLLVMVAAHMLLLLSACRGVPGLLSWLWRLHIRGEDQPCIGETQQPTWCSQHISNTQV